MAVMATASDIWDPLEFLLNNGVPNQDWFDKINLTQLSSLIEKIKATVDDVETKSENDKILKLLQATVTIAKGLLEHTQQVNKSSQEFASTNDNEGSCDNKSELSNSQSLKNVKDEAYLDAEKSENTLSSTTSSIFPRFSRGSDRLSTLNNNNINVWIEAADRHLSQLNDKVDTISRAKINEEKTREDNESLTDQAKNNDKSVIYTIHMGNSRVLGMGIDVHCDSNFGTLQGIRIKSISKNGVIGKDGRLSENDIILEINEQKISQLTWEQAQNLFKNAIKSPDITFKVLKHGSQSQNCSSVNKPYKQTTPIKPPRNDPITNDSDNKTVSHNRNSNTAGANTPSKRLSANLGNSTLKSPFGSLIKVVKKHSIKLVKSRDGLGFVISTRDNPAAEACPIFVKAILPKGSAIVDGRLKSGDRLLQVNGVDMEGKSYEEAKAILRNIGLGSTCELIVSRQEDSTAESPPEPLSSPRKIDIDGNKELLKLVIPLNDTGSAGLGIGLKAGQAKNSNKINKDLGIFVKNVINGGAASKDGRLRRDDRLLSINGYSLLGLTNKEALDVFKRALVSGEGPETQPNAIVLDISRSLKSEDESDEAKDSNSCEEITSLNTRYEDVAVLGGKHATLPYFKRDIPSPYIKRDEITNTLKQDESWSKYDETTYDLDLTNNSYRSNENTVIYNPGNGGKNIVKTPVSVDMPFNRHPVVECLTNSTPRKLTKQWTGENDEVINKGIEDDSSFTRDGFGRQSISEKRYASLDAKNTDTYRRNKQNKEERAKEKERLRQKIELEDESKSGEDFSVKNVKKNLKNGTIFSPKCCWICRSPGSCPYHVQPTKDNEAGSSIGMKKSISLERLQTMMQELQKEQLNSRGENPFSGPRPATLKVTRNRATNESFRAAVDKSYDDNPSQMETLAEEGSESGSSILASRMEAYKRKTNEINTIPSGVALSTTGTQGTATSSVFTSGDDKDGDEVKLCRKREGSSSKKKSLIKNLFRFASKKNKEKVNKKELEVEVEKMRARKAAQIEQERIQEHFRKFMEANISKPEKPKENHHPVNIRKVNRIPNHRHSSYNSNYNASPRDAPMHSMMRFFSDASCNPSSIGIPTAVYDSQRAQKVVRPSTERGENELLLSGYDNKYGYHYSDRFTRKDIDQFETYGDAQHLRNTMLAMREPMRRAASCRAPYLKRANTNDFYYVG